MSCGAFDKVGSGVLSQYETESYIETTFLLLQVIFLQLPIKCGSTDAQCPCCIGDIIACHFKCVDDGSPFNFVKRENDGGIRPGTCKGDKRRR